MAFKFRDSLSRRLIRAMKDDPRYHATVKQVAILPRQIEVNTYQPNRWILGSYSEGSHGFTPQDSPVAAMSQQPVSSESVDVVKSPSGSTMAHELTHVLHREALNRGDRKAWSLQQTAPEYG